MGGKEPAGSTQEPGAGVASLVSQDLDVGQAGVVVDGGMHIVVAGPAAPVAGAVLGRVAAVDAVAATGAQAAELLDVEVDQLARVGALVAADHCPARAIQDSQTVELVADQDTVDGGGRPPNPRRDTGWAELMGLPQPADLGLHRRRDLVRMAVGAAWPVDEPARASLPVAGPPAVGTGTGDAHLGSDVSGGTASGDALAQDQPSRRGQAGVSVGHWDLRVVRMPWTAPHLRPEVPSPVNNPRGQYS